MNPGDLVETPLGYSAMVVGPTPDLPGCTDVLILAWVLEAFDHGDTAPALPFLTTNLKEYNP